MEQSLLRLRTTRTTARISFAVAVFALVGSTYFTVGGPVAQAAATNDEASGHVYEVTVTNLTRGQGFGLPLVVSHDGRTQLFELGSSASLGIQRLAEDGDNNPLAAEADAMPGTLAVVKGTEPIPPGASRTFRIRASARFDKVTVLGMLGTTNDTFGAAVDIDVPMNGGGSCAEGDAYDAGTERNSESCMYIPGPPCGNPGVRDPDGSEGYVYVSNGIHGIGDLDPAVFDWNNPVVGVSIRRASN